MALSLKLSTEEHKKRNVYGWKNYVREQIAEGFKKFALPEYMYEDVLLWVMEGISPSTFLLSVLENNFKGAVFGADENNSAKIKEWAWFAHWHLPGGCHGSREAVVAWGGINNLDPMIDSRDINRAGNPQDEPS